jgi:uncharacterized protein YodC (DUF2158 family)
MRLWRSRIKASDIQLIRAAESFSDPREPAFQLGDFVKLNSGGPTMIVVDKEGAIAVLAWRDRSGGICERRFPFPCIHRVLVA